MKRKYLEEEFGMFYYDEGKSLIFSFNSRKEKEMDVSSMEKEDIEKIVSHNERLINLLAKILENNEEAVKTYYNEI